MLRILVLLALFGAICQATVEIVENEDDLVHLALEDEHDASIAVRGKLINELFKDYDKKNYPSNFTTRFGISLIRFDVNEETGTVDTNLWQRVRWTDPRLRWKPEEYDGQTVLRLPSDSIWKPDIRLYNSITSLDDAHCSNTNVLVFHDGAVIHVPPCHYQSACDVSHLITHPYGETTCELKFGSWTFDGDLIDLQFHDANHTLHDAEMSHFADVTSWEFVSHNATRHEKYYPCCPHHPYTDITYNFVFKRKNNRGHCHA